MDPVMRVQRALRDLALRVVTIESTAVTSAAPLRVQGSDGDVELLALGWYRPRVGDTVQVLRAGQRALVLGASVPNQPTRPGMDGTVTAVGGATLTVTVGGVSHELPFLDTYASPLVGDSVKVLWQEYGAGVFQGLVVGKSGAVSGSTSTSTTPQTVPDAPQSSPTTELGDVLTVSPFDAGTWRNGAWRTDTLKLVSGDWTGVGVNHAYLFYGGRFGAAQGRTVASARVWLVASAGGTYGDTATPLRLHASQSKGSSEPTTSDAFAGTPLSDNEGAWHTIPPATAQLLVDNPSYGLAVYGTGSADYSTYHPLGYQHTRGGPLQGDVEFTFTPTAAA